MKISFGLLPDHPLPEILEAIEVADQLGFHAVYGADETFHKDSFQIFAAAAHRTSRIVFAPDVTHVILRDPTMVVQAMATLDELTGGRTELIYSIGNFAMLEQYHLQERTRRPLARLREAHDLMRKFLDEGVLEHEGEFYKCTGMFTSARPVQERMPIMIGAMRGPSRSSSQVRSRTACTRRSATRGRRSSTPPTTSASARSGPAATGDARHRRLGRQPASPRTAQAARECVRVLVAFYIPAMPSSRCSATA